MSQSLLQLTTTTDADNWPDLVPLDVINLPGFEANCLPSWAGDYADALALATETPVELPVGMILAVCATAAARCLRVQVSSDYSEPCNLWIMVALPSGNRKSAVQSAAIKPLIQWEQRQSESILAEIKQLTSERETSEARIKQLRQQFHKRIGPTAPGPYRAK